MKTNMLLMILNPMFWIRNAKTIFGGIPNAFRKGSNHTQTYNKMSPQELVRLLEAKASENQCLTEEEYATLCDMYFAHLHLGLYLDTDAEIMESLKKYSLVAELYDRHKDAEEKIKSGEAAEMMDRVLKNTFDAFDKQVK